MPIIATRDAPYALGYHITMERPENFEVLYRIIDRDPASPARTKIEDELEADGRLDKILEWANRRDQCNAAVQRVCYFCHSRNTITNTKMIMSCRKCGKVYQIVDTDVIAASINEPTE